MTDPILLSGVSRTERHRTISSATDVIEQAGGWVEDVHFFSNIAVNLRCVLMPATAAQMSRALSRLGIGLSRGETAALERAAERMPVDEELHFSLQIAFVHDEPDLRRHLPRVPG
jgi:hypothetical protein